mgnify:CR=1 FL=1
MIRITIALALALAIYTFPPFLYPTQDGLTLGIGSYGYHIEYYPSQ